MHKLLNIFLVIILLSACSKNDPNNETKLSSLIKPDFLYTQDLFNCTLNENQSLIGLESFFSKNIEKQSQSIAKVVNIEFMKNKNSFSQQDWKELYKLSEETFVDESDSLKKTGAGAGLTDND